MKKKLLCLFLAMVMVLAFAACGEDKNSTDTGDKGKSDFDAFMEVQQNMKDIKDMEFKMDMDMNTDSGDPDTKTNVKMSGTGKEVMKSKDDIQMELKYTMTIPNLGSDLEGTMYMKDKALYMELMGQKLKMDASNEMAAMMNVDTDQLLAITEDMISDLKVSQEGDDTAYTFTMDADKALDYFQKNAGASQQLDSIENVTFDKMNVKVLAGKDKMAKNIDMDCDMTTKVDDQTAKISYQITMEYVSINTDLKIDFPDFSSYQELSV